MAIIDYSTTPASNTSLFPENMAPSAVNNGMRQVQADIRADVTVCFNTSALMAAVDLDSVAAGDVVRTRGKASAGDGAGGYFTVTKSDISTEVALDTAGAIYVPFSTAPGDGTTGGFIRDILDPAVLYTAWAAPTKDGSDETTKVQALIDLLPETGGVVHIAKGHGFNLADLTLTTTATIGGVDLTYYAQDELDSPSTTGQTTNELIYFKSNKNAAGDANEWHFASPLHPGIVLDAREDKANIGAGTQAGLSSVVFRKENINQWQIGPQTDGQYSVSAWEYVYTIDLGTDDFSVNPSVGDTIAGDTSGATGVIKTIGATSMTVSWRSGIFTTGETLTSSGNTSTSNTSSVSASYTTRFNKVVVARDGGGAGANMATADIQNAWDVGGILGIMDAAGGVFGAASAALRIYDNLASPTYGVRFQPGASNLKIYDSAAVELAEIEWTTGNWTLKGDCTLTGGGLITNTYTSTQLNDISHAVNTTGKAIGKQVYNLTVDRPVWAFDATAGGVWRYADGTTANTPV